MADVKPLSLRQNTIYNAVGSLAYQGFQWLITVLVVLLSSDYANSGVLAYAMTVGNMFSSIAIYSTRAFQVSDTKNKYSQSNYIAFRVVTIFIAGVICIIYSLVITQSVSSIVVVLLYLLFKADESFALILYGADQKLIGWTISVFRNWFEVFYRYRVSAGCCISRKVWRCLS